MHFVERFIHVFIVDHYISMGKTPSGIMKIGSKLAEMEELQNRKCHGMPPEYVPDGMQMTEEYEAGRVQVGMGSCQSATRRVRLFMVS